jgi:hypothetical protein
MTCSKTKGAKMIKSARPSKVRGRILLRIEVCGVGALAVAMVDAFISGGVKPVRV